MSNTSWDVVTVINTAPINQQLTNQLRNTAINFTSTSSDQMGDKVSLASTIVDLALLHGSSGQDLILALTLNGSISFAMAGGGDPVAYGLDQLVLPMRCVVKSFADAGTTTVSLPLSSAILASDQLNQTAAIAALIPQENALPANAGLIQAVATAVANGLQQTTAVGAELARISDLTIAHAQAPVRQIGCAVQPIAGGSLLFMMLSYSGSTPLQADVDASQSAALSEQGPSRAVVFIAQDFFMDTIFGSGTLPNGQGFAYSPATATLSLPAPFVMASSGGTLQQFTWQAIGSGLNVAATAVWSSGSGAMNVTITATFNATYIPVIQGGVVALVPQNPPSVNQNVDKGWLAEILGIATAFGGHPVQQLYNSISGSMASNVASLVQTSLLGTIAHLVSWSGSGAFTPTAATLNNGLSVVGTILPPPS